MKKRIFAIISILIMVLMISTATAFASSYSSGFSVSQSLVGGVRSYQGGSDMGINCSNVSLIIPAGYALVNSPATYNVTLYKGSTSQGSVVGFPIDTATWNGKWYGAGPGSNTLNYHYNFTAVNTRTTDYAGHYGYATITGSCIMYSE